MCPTPLSSRSEDNANRTNRIGIRRTLSNETERDALIAGVECKALIVEVSRETMMSHDESFLILVGFFGSALF